MCRTVTIDRLGPWTRIEESVSAVDNEFYEWMQYYNSSFLKPPLCGAAINQNHWVPRRTQAFSSINRIVCGGWMGVIVIRGPDTVRPALTLPVTLFNIGYSEYLIQKLRVDYDIYGSILRWGGAERRSCDTARYYLLTRWSSWMVCGHMS